MRILYGKMNLGIFSAAVGYSVAVRWMRTVVWSPKNSQWCPENSGVLVSATFCIWCLMWVKCFLFELKKKFPFTYQKISFVFIKYAILTNTFPIIWIFLHHWSEHVYTFNIRPNNCYAELWERLLTTSPLCFRYTWHQYLFPAYFNRKTIHISHLSICSVLSLNSSFFLLHIVALNVSTNQHFQTTTP